MARTANQLILLEAVAARFVGDDKAGTILPLFIGAYIDSLLMGLAIVQMFQYRRYLRKDKPYIVVMVILAFACTLASSIMSALWMVSLFVSTYGKFLPFTGTIWLCRHLAADVLCGVVVQVFYIDRLTRLWKSYWPAVLIGPFSLGNLVLGGYNIYHYSRFDMIRPDYDGIPILQILLYSLLSCILFSDLLLTAGLTYGLSRQKTGWKHTDSMLSQMIYRCLETQTFALLSAVAVIIAWKGKFAVGVCFMLFQSKFYYLGLQLTLNLRPSSTPTSVNVSYTSAPISPNQYSQRHNSSQRGNVGQSHEELGPAPVNHRPYPSESQSKASEGDLHYARPVEHEKSIGFGSRETLSQAKGVAL